MHGKVRNVVESERVTPGLVTRRSCSAVDREPRSGRPRYHPRQHCRPSPQLVTLTTTLTANPRRAVVMIHARASAGGRREAPARAPVEAVGAPRRTCRRRPGRRRWSPGGPTGAVQRARLGSQLEELRVQRLAARQRRHLAAQCNKIVSILPARRYATAVLVMYLIISYQKFIVRPLLRGLRP